MKFKFEITQVVRDTDLVENARGDGKTQAIFTVKYRVRFHNTMSMDAQEVLWASDELDAYNKAKQIIRDKQSHGEF